MPGPSILWLALGVVLLAFEALALPGVGLMFAGLGAIITGIFTELHFTAEDDYAMQGAVFCTSTIAFALLLWKRIKVWRLNPKEQPYSNIVGTTATVAAGGLNKGARGHVLWSGTRMQAELDAACTADTLPEGAPVRVTGTQGNILIVTQA